MSKLYSVDGKMSGSGLKVTWVPRFCVLPISARRAVGLTALVALQVDLAVAPDLELEVLRQGVDDRDSDAVQTARDLVGVLVELAAGVKLGQHDLGGRDPFGRDGCRPGCRGRRRSTVTEPSTWIVTVTRVQ